MAHPSRRCGAFVGDHQKMAGSQVGRAGPCQLPGSHTENELGRHKPTKLLGQIVVVSHFPQHGELLSPGLGPRRRVEKNAQKNDRRSLGL